MFIETLYHFSHFSVWVSHILKEQKKLAHIEREREREREREQFGVANQRVVEVSYRGLQALKITKDFFSLMRFGVNFFFLVNSKDIY